MAFSEHLAARTRRTLMGVEGLTERQMFGGLAFLVRGNMCCGIIGDELMVRVGPEHYTASLAQPHAREMDLTGRAMKGMVYVAEEGIREDLQLQSWAARGLEFVSTLPPK